MNNNLKEKFEHLAEVHSDYLSQWYLENPVIVSSEKYKELNRIQRILEKTILYFVSHYRDFYDKFILDEKVIRILEVCEKYPYRIGTYRPDFLVDLNGKVKICEIGARFPLNGYFLSGIAEYIGYSKLRIPYVDKGGNYEKFLNYLFQYWGEFKELCVLKGNDRPCDIKYYIPFFESLGVKVQVISTDNISDNIYKLENTAVINEFNQMELEALDLQIIEKIAASNAINDMRSIFLIHDKRFLSFLSDSDFLSLCLDEEEKEILHQFIIPTYIYNNSNVWQEARNNKDEWLLKHALLGKSEKVYAGCLMEKREWEDLFVSDEIKNMVLQPYIKQKRFYSRIREKEYRDYVVGTLLCFDDQFFGPGIFRTSSYEITNRIDDRKMVAQITDCVNKDKMSIIL